MEEEERIQRSELNSLPTRLGATRLIEEFNSLRVQLGMALCRLKLTSDQAMCDQAHRRVQFSQSSTRNGVVQSQASVGLEALSVNM